MKQKITNPDQDVELVEQEKPCDHTVSDSAEEINELFYLLANSYPFIPMIDFTIVFDEVKKMVKRWFSNKRDCTNHL